jgi:CheY-like chemotaxis protein
MKDIFLSLVGFLAIALILSPLYMPNSVAQQQQQQQKQTPVSSQRLTASTTAKQVVDAFKAGVLFKDYIAAAVKNPESPERKIIRDQLSAGNTVCGGSDAATKANMCDGILSFAKLSCEVDSSISPNCSHQYIDQYITQRHLDALNINKDAYRQLGHLVVELHPEAQGNDEVFQLR